VPSGFEAQARPTPCGPATSARSLTGFSASRCGLIPLGDQSPGGLDDEAAEQRERHVGVLGEPSGGQDERLYYGVGFRNSSKLRH
jgi:hypothetical protein